MGRYSRNLSRALAITLVNNKKHPVFSKFVDNKMSFWFRYGDRKLHYGRGHLEGSLTLNKKGKIYYEKNKESWN